MKLCILTLNLNTLGGVQVVVSQILKELDINYGYKIDVLMPSDKGKRVADTQLTQGIQTFDLDEILSIPNSSMHIIRNRLLGLNRRTAIFNKTFLASFMARLYFPTAARNRLIEFINKNQYDVVIGVTDRYTHYVSMITPEIKAKTFGWEHSTFDGYFRKKAFASYGLEAMFKKYARSLDGIMALTTSDKNKFEAASGVDAMVLHNPSFVKNPDKKARFSNKVLWVGRLAKRVKGLDYLVEIIEKTISKNNDIEFVVVGDGIDHEYLTSEIQSRNLMKNVHLEGYHSDLKGYYSSSGMIISTSRWEGFGMTLVEGMSYGLPAVSFINEGPIEIIDEKNGSLIEKYDTSKFSDVICSIIKNQKRWEEMSLHAWESSRKYDKNIIIQKFVDFIENK